MTYTERITMAQAAPETAVCRHCHHTKSRHGKMGYSCPPPCRKSFELEEGSDRG